MLANTRAKTDGVSNQVVAGKTYDIDWQDAKYLTEIGKARYVEPRAPRAAQKQLPGATTKDPGDDGKKLDGESGNGSGTGSRPYMVTAKVSGLIWPANPYRLYRLPTIPAVV